MLEEEELCKDSQILAFKAFMPAIDDSIATCFS